MKTIQLNGISHKIRFNFNALKEFNTLNGGTGLSFSDQMDFGTVLDLTYVGIKEAHRIECKSNGKPNDFALTIEDVGEDMTTELMIEVINILTEDLAGGKNATKK